MLGLWDITWKLVRAVGFIIVSAVTLFLISLIFTRKNSSSRALRAATGVVLIALLVDIVLSIINFGGVLGFILKVIISGIIVPLHMIMDSYDVGFIRAIVMWLLWMVFNAFVFGILALILGFALAAIIIGMPFV